MKIGIIGLGFVGGAIHHAYKFHNTVELVLYDPYKGLEANDSELKTCDALFISVPSPENKDGSCNTSILESVLNKFKDYKGIFISKVTASPVKYQELQKIYPNLVHAPEFLVAATAKEDYINGKFAIIGGDTNYCLTALDIIKLGQPNIENFKICSIQEAALAKYTINTFLATKVIFMNQIKALADAVNVDYTVLTECVKLDDRVGHSHFQVPGPDGKFGFGGACFPKDTAALNYLAKSLTIDMSVLNQAIETNKKIRN